MTADPASAVQGETQILVRYWASARSAAGVAADRLEAAEPTTLAEVRRRVLARHETSDRLSAVLAVCSALVGDVPAGTADPEAVVVRPGQTVEFLPPFAGG